MKTLLFVLFALTSFSAQADLSCFLEKEQVEVAKKCSENFKNCPQKAKDQAIDIYVELGVFFSNEGARNMYKKMADTLAKESLTTEVYKQVLNHIFVGQGYDDPTPDEHGKICGTIEKALSK